MVAPTAPVLRRTPLPPCPCRVSGRLALDAAFYPTAQGGAFLQLLLRPTQGLDYSARVLLGTDLADHFGAQALLPQMRAGAMVSVACTGLDLRTDHDHAVLALRDAHSVVVFSDPIHRSQEAADVA